MPRANGSAPPEAIRIEDEVWEQAFSRREPSSETRRRRLRAIDGGQADWLSDGPPAWLSELHDDWHTHAESSVATSPRFQIASGTSSETTTSAAAQTATFTPTDAAAPVRRTIKIQGRGAERHMPLPDANRRRSPQRAYERAGFRPDRLAMWAVILGFLLVFVAVISAHG